MADQPPPLGAPVPSAVISVHTGLGQERCLGSSQSVSWTLTWDSTVTTMHPPYTQQKQVRQQNLQVATRSNSMFLNSPPLAALFLGASSPGGGESVPYKWTILMGKKTQELIEGIFSNLTFHGHTILLLCFPFSFNMLVFHYSIYHLPLSFSISSPPLTQSV